MCRMFQVATHHNFAVGRAGGRGGATSYIPAVDTSPATPRNNMMRSIEPLQRENVQRSSAVMVQTNGKTPNLCGSPDLDAVKKGKKASDVDCELSRIPYHRSNTHHSHTITTCMQLTRISPPSLLTTCRPVSRPLNG